MKIMSQTTPRQPRSTQQSRIVATLRARDLHLLRSRAKRALIDLPVHLLRKQIPTIHSPTGNHNNLRIDQVDQIREPDPQIHPKALEHRERELVTGPASLVNLLRRELTTLQSRLRKLRQTLARHPHDRSRRRKQFQAASVATLA